MVGYGFPAATANVYDPLLDVWTAIDPMPGPRMTGAAVTAADGRIFAIGGEYDNPTGASVVAYGSPAPPDPDADDDGIYDEVDTVPATASVDFDDGDGNFGSIVDTDGLPVTIADDTNPTEGVRVVVGGTGSQEVTLDTCEDFTVNVQAGSEAVITCNSVIVHVVSVAANIELGGGATVVAVPIGATVEVTDLGDDVFIVDNLGSVDVTVTVDGVETTIEGGTEQQVTTWDFQGFSAPVDNPMVLNVLNAGQAVPLKWRLARADGTPVTDLASVSVHVTSITCSEGTTADQLEELGAGDSGLQNLGDGYYQFNWKTPKNYAKSCKTMHLDLGEGVEREALFRFPK